MPILDRYYTRISIKPDFYALFELSCYGYFDTKDELATILESVGGRISQVDDLHISIEDVSNSKSVAEVHFAAKGKKRSDVITGEHLDFTNHIDTMHLINKYFDLSSNQHNHHRYLCEFNLEIDDEEKKNKVILGFFSSVNEFSHILSEVGKKVKEDGTFSFSIYQLNKGSKKLCSKVYKMYLAGTILVPEIMPHYLDMKKELDLQNYALSLWENEFEA